MANVSLTTLTKKVTPRFFKILVEQMRSFFLGGVYKLDPSCEAGNGLISFG